MIKLKTIKDCLQNNFEINDNENDKKELAFSISNLICVQSIYKPILLSDMIGIYRVQNISPNKKERCRQNEIMCRAQSHNGFCALQELFLGQMIARERSIWNSVIYLITFIRDFSDSGVGSCSDCGKGKRMGLIIHKKHTMSTTEEKSEPDEQ